MFVSLDTFSMLGGQEVTHRTAVPEVQGSISSSDKDLDVCFLFFYPKTLFVIQCFHSPCNAILFRILNILQAPRSIIRVSRYKQRIFKHID